MKLQGHKPVSNGMDIVAVGCLFEERTLMAKGIVIDKNTDWKHIPSSSELSFSTCKIAKAGIGGPLIDMLGNIVGMNFYHEECTPFLSSSIILGLLENDFLKDICAKWKKIYIEQHVVRDRYAGPTRGCAAATRAKAAPAVRPGARRLATTKEARAKPSTQTASDHQGSKGQAIYTDGEAGAI
ncbi:hypothetical protein QYE76_038549 [Lolium multiflorum]|uniref:Uncharacterized protein n=1 Tax=Lolium multiflorum TaxID=4521 RepID=A0AAD8WSZ7_LOLMU|nr:hypothetical protein QYE76_038549 [Lolium multiflorum]